MTSPRDYAYILQNDTLHVTLADGTGFTWEKSHPGYVNVLAHINADDVNSAQLKNLMDVQARVKAATATYDNIVVSPEGVTVDGLVLDNGLTRRMIKIVSEGGDPGVLLPFLANLSQNPREAAVYELYEFLKHSQMPLTPDGHFIAYKIVGPSYMDKYSGKFDNSPGKFVAMRPFDVDDNRHNTCSRGLHVCAKSYLPSYGNAIGGNDRIVICKINPAHVVAVPSDYHNAKMRVWKYEVIGELNDKDKAGVFEKKGIFIPSEHHGQYATFVGEPEVPEDADFDERDEVEIDEPECDCDSEGETASAQDDEEAILYVEDEFQKGTFYEATVGDIRAKRQLYIQNAAGDYQKV